MEDKERWRNGSILKDTEETWQSNVIYDPGGVLDQERVTYKEHHIDNRQNVNMDCVHWVTVLYQC